MYVQCNIVRHCISIVAVETQQSTLLIVVDVQHILYCLYYLVCPKQPNSSLLEETYMEIVCYCQ